MDTQAPSAGHCQALAKLIGEALNAGMSVADCAVLLERGPQIAVGLAKERPRLAQAVAEARATLPWQAIDDAFCSGLRKAGRRAHSKVRLRMALRQLADVECRVKRCENWIKFAEQGIEERDLRSANLALHLMRNEWHR